MDYALTILLCGQQAKQVEAENLNHRSDLVFSCHIRCFSFSSSSVPWIIPVWKSEEAQWQVWKGASQRTLSKIHYITILSVILSINNPMCVYVCVQNGGKSSKIDGKRKEQGKKWITQLMWVFRSWPDGVLGWSYPLLSFSSFPKWP